MSLISRDGHHIKRPLNSFMVWAKEKRRTMNRDNPKMRNAEISKILGEEWRQMPEEAKQPYVEEAVRLRKQHKVNHPNYRYKPKRKQRQDQAALEKSRSEGLSLFSGIYPSILSTPAQSVFNSPSYSPYNPDLFAPRFPAESLPFSSELLVKAPTSIPSSVFTPYPSRSMNVPSSYSANYPGPSSSYCSESPRMPRPKDNPIRIAPLCLQPSTASRTNSLNPGSSVIDSSKQPLPYLMLKAEVKYM